MQLRRHHFLKRLSRVLLQYQFGALLLLRGDDFPRLSSVFARILGCFRRVGIIAIRRSDAAARSRNGLLPQNGIARYVGASRIET